MIGLVVLALLLAAAVVLATSAPASCGDADASRERDVLGDAEKAYGAILSDEPGSTCARAGMVLALGRRCELAGKLHLADRDEEAEKMLAAALAAEPSVLLDAQGEESGEQQEKRKEVRVCLVRALAKLDAGQGDPPGGAPAASSCVCAPCAVVCDDERQGGPKPKEPEGNKPRPDKTRDDDEPPDDDGPPGDDDGPPDDERTPTPTPDGPPDHDDTPTPTPTPDRTPSADCSARRC
jgi:hypothetical protein